MNGSVMKIAGVEALQQNILETKAYVAEHGGGGHTILNGSAISMAGRSNLQFNGLDVSDNSLDDKTVVSMQTALSSEITNIKNSFVITPEPISIPQPMSAGEVQIVKNAFVIS